MTSWLKKINDKFIYIYRFCSSFRLKSLKDGVVSLSYKYYSQSILAVSYGIIVIPSVHSFFYKQPVYKQRGLNSDVLSNLAFTFSWLNQLQCMIFWQIKFFRWFLCIKTYKIKQQLSNFEASNHPNFLSNRALNLESRCL